MDDWSVRKTDLYNILSKDRERELAFIQEIDKEWANERRLEHVKKQYNECLTKRTRMIKSGSPRWLINVVMNTMDASKWSKLRKLLTKPERLENGLTDQMIEQARNHPIENIVNVNSKHYALCVNHSDTKPSMFCRNNFAYCFSCGWTTDVIGLYMAVNNVDFITAVKALS